MSSHRVSYSAQSQAPSWVPVRHRRPPWKIGRNLVLALHLPVGRGCLLGGGGMGIFGPSSRSLVSPYKGSKGSSSGLGLGGVGWGTKAAQAQGRPLL